MSGRGRSLVLVVALLIPATALAGGPRFPRKAAPGDSGKLVHAARQVLLPLYQLRGILFQTRLELSLLRAPAGERARWSRWLSLPAGEAGYAAETLLRARQLPPPQRLELVAANTPTLGAGGDEGTLAQQMLSLVDADMLLPGTPLVADDALVANLVAEPSALSRLAKRLRRVPKIAGRLRRTPNRVAEVRRRFAKASTAVKRKGKGALAGNMGSILGLAAEGIVAGVSVPDLVTDLTQAPSASQAILLDSKALGAMLPDLQARVVALAPQLGPQLGFALVVEGVERALPKSGVYGPLFATLGKPAPLVAAGPALPLALMTTTQPRSEQAPAPGAGPFTLRAAPTARPAPASPATGPSAPTASSAGPTPTSAPPASTAAAAPPPIAPSALTPDAAPPASVAAAAASPRTPPRPPVTHASPPSDPRIETLQAQLAYQHQRVEQMDAALRAALHRLAQLELRAGAGGYAPAPAPQPTRR